MKKKEEEYYISLCKQLIQKVPKDKKKLLGGFLETLIKCNKKTIEIENIDKELVIERAEKYANNPDFNFDAYTAVPLEEKIKEIENEIEMWEESAVEYKKKDWIFGLLEIYKETLNVLKETQKVEEELKSAKKKLAENRKLVYDDFISQGFSENDAKRYSEDGTLLIKDVLDIYKKKYLD